MSIYRTRAADYDRLVSREDFEGNILPALQEIRPLQGLDVVELGAGTGRLSMLLAPLVRRIYLFDISAHMLYTAGSKLGRAGLRHWSLTVADHRALPLPAGMADLALAGWSLGHFPGWYPDGWQAEVSLALSEMRRVLRPGGSIILLETLGTGEEMPQPPSPGLAHYTRWLEKEQGFLGSWIRTDYRFENISEAEHLLRFFFDHELANRLIRKGMTDVPECTGIWSLTI